MAILSLLTKFTRSGFKTTRTAAKNVKNTARNVRKLRAETINKVPAKAAVSTTMGKVPKPAITTQTEIAAKTGGVLSGSTSRQILNSKTAKIAGQAALGGVVVGGSTLALGSLAGKGLANFGTGVRGLTGNYTDEEIAAQENDILGDRLALLDDYQNFLQSNGLADSPSTRGVYDDFVLGSGPAQEEEKVEGNGKGWLVALGAVALGGAAYYAYKKSKKKSGKKK